MPKESSTIARSLLLERATIWYFDSLQYFRVYGLYEQLLDKYKLLCLLQHLEWHPRHVMGVYI
jgi:hypothetical protein